jgi:hypothetical protein
MSDGAVRAAIQTLEAWLADPECPLDEIALEAWNRDFQTALAGAEKGPGWPELVARGHRLAERVESRRQAVAAQRDAVRLELEQQVQGDRALKGYGSSTR